MFLDLAYFEIFYQPNRIHLDLYVKYSTLLMADPRVAPGYFENYLKYPELTQSGQPENCTNEDQVFELISKAVQIVSRQVVFETSDCPDIWPRAAKTWPQSKFVVFGENSLVAKLDVPPEQILLVTKKAFLEEYCYEVRRILAFCGAVGLEKTEFFLTSDFVRLLLSEKAGYSQAAPAFCSDQIERADLETILEQKLSIDELGKSEVAIASLQTQLEIVHRAANERLDLINLLNSKIQS